MSNQIIVLKYEWKTNWDKVEYDFAKLFGVRRKDYHGKI